MSGGVQSVSVGALSSSVHTAVHARAAASSGRAPVIIRGECEAIGLLRVIVEGDEGQRAWAIAEAGRLLRSWATPWGARPVILRRYTYGQLRELARRHAGGESVRVLARELGLSRHSAQHHLRPSGSMLAALVEGELAEFFMGRALDGDRTFDQGHRGAANAGEGAADGVRSQSGERLLPDRQEKLQGAAAGKPVGMARAKRAREGGGAA